MSGAWGDDEQDWDRDDRTVHRDAHAIERAGAMSDDHKRRPHERTLHSGVNKRTHSDKPKRDRIARLRQRLERAECSNELRSVINGVLDLLADEL